MFFVVVFIPAFGDGW